MKGTDAREDASTLRFSPWVQALRRGSEAVARHWLAVANALNLLVVGVAAAVPVMAAAGLEAVADPVFASYRLVCHQLPYRSFFLFGHQMAMCERNVAIYGSMALAGLAFGLVRGRAGPLPWRWYLAALLPMAVDGLTQLAGVRESTWELRVLTGSLFGSATVALAYPHLHRFAEMVIRGGSEAEGDGTSRMYRMYRMGNEGPS